MMKVSFNACEFLNSPVANHVKQLVLQINKMLSYQHLQSATQFKGG
jgi:hypothetical protein